MESPIDEIVIKSLYVFDNYYMPIRKIGVHPQERKEVISRMIKYNKSSIIVSEEEVEDKMYDLIIKHFMR